MGAVEMMKILPKREPKTLPAPSVVPIFCSSSISESLSYQVHPWGSFSSKTALKQGVGAVQTGWQVLSMLLRDKFYF